MNSALIGITAGWEAWNCIGASWINCTGIEAAATAFFKTPVMGHGVMRGGGVVPSYGSSAGDRDGRRDVIRGSAVHQHPALRRSGAGWPHASHENNCHEKDTS